MHGHRHRHRKRTQTQTQTRKRTHTHHNTIVFAYRQNASTGLARAAPQTAHTTRGPTAWCWSGAVHIAQTAAPGAVARPHVVQLSPTTPAAARATGRGPDHGCVMAAQSVGSHPAGAGPFNHCAHVMTRGTSFAPTKGGVRGPHAGGGCEAHEARAGGGDHCDLQRGWRPPGVRRRSAAVPRGPQRAALSMILIKYAFKISIQFWSRRDNSVVPLAEACSVGPVCP